MKKPRIQSVDVNVRMPLVMRDALNRVAAKQMRSVSNLACKILADHLVNHKILSREEIAGLDFLSLNIEPDN